MGRQRAQAKGKTQAPPPRIPGPAGAVDEIANRATDWGGNGIDGPIVLSQRPAAMSNSFVRSAAWLQLEAELAENALRILAHLL